MPAYDFEKRVDDNWGDPIRVQADAGSLFVVTISTSHGQDTEMNYTPQRARKLAKALLKAAKVAEGNA